MPSPWSSFVCLGPISHVSGPIYLTHGPKAHAKGSPAKWSNSWAKGPTLSPLDPTLLTTFLHRF